MKWRISCIFFTRQGFWFTRHSSVSGLAHAQSCPALCDPMDCSLSDSSVHGILQARILEWVVMPTFNGSSQPRDRTQVSRIAGGFFTIWATREAHYWDTDAGLQARGWPLRRTRSSQFWMEWWSLCHLHSAAGGLRAARTCFAHPPQHRSYWESGCLRQAFPEEGEGLRGAEQGASIRWNTSLGEASAVSSSSFHTYKWKEREGRFHLPTLWATVGLRCLSLTCRPSPLFLSSPPWDDDYESHPSVTWKKRHVQWLIYSSVVV